MQMKDRLSETGQLQVSEVLNMQPKDRMSGTGQLPNDLLKGTILPTDMHTTDQLNGAGQLQANDLMRGTVLPADMHMKDRLGESAAPAGSRVQVDGHFRVTPVRDEAGHDHARSEMLQRALRSNGLLDGKAASFDIDSTSQFGVRKYLNADIT